MASQIRVAATIKQLSFLRQYFFISESGRNLWGPEHERLMFRQGQARFPLEGCYAIASRERYLQVRYRGEGTTITVESCVGDDDDENFHDRLQLPVATKYQSRLIIVLIF